jgi:dTDP-4-dehydrorhamnose 3,5-epimerase
MDHDHIADGRIDGVRVRPLAPHVDSRGRLIEIYREGWNSVCHIVQFNAVASEANVLRGVHVHVRHVDHLVLVGGRMTLGLHDLRPWSPTAGASARMEIVAAIPRAVVIPPGVAHGFYFSEPSMHVYGVSSYWDPNDEIACRWDAAELGLAWPTSAPILSERDKEAPDYAACVDAFLRTWSRIHGSLPAGGAG